MNEVVTQFSDEFLDKLIDDFYNIFMKFHTAFVKRGLNSETATDLAKIMVAKLSLTKQEMLQEQKYRATLKNGPQLDCKWSKDFNP